MKKIEFSFIKKASKNQLVTFCQFSFGALSLLSLSHTIGDLEFSWSTLGGCGILGFLEKEGKGRPGKCKRASTLTQFFLQVPSRMYDFITSFGMHGMCMWIIDHDMSLAWRISYIYNLFHNLTISWIAMEFLGLFPCLILVGSHVSLDWIELLVLGSPSWTNALEAL